MVLCLLRCIIWFDTWITRKETCMYQKGEKSSSTYILVLTKIIWNGKDDSFSNLMLWCVSIWCEVLSFQISIYVCLYGNADHKYKANILFILQHLQLCFKSPKLVLSRCFYKCDQCPVMLFIIYVKIWDIQALLFCNAYILIPWITKIGMYFELWIAK